MKIPWLRGRFLARRQLDRIFLDFPDAFLRRLTGRAHLPPYSLRSFVGGASDFERIGRAFVDEAWSLQLFGPGTRILDVGCGCGRMARALADDSRLQTLGISYTGMDIDRECVDWCRRQLTPLDNRFHFYQADCSNPSYNPGGSETAAHYAFPHSDASFDLILLTSVMTHLLEEDLRHYLSEVSRMLAPGGIAYASFFLYASLADARTGAQRHGIRFPFVLRNCAVNREDYPTNAVAWGEAYVRRTAMESGLEAIGPVRYGRQDVLLFGKAPGSWASAELLQGWHELEEGCWRWTERRFSVSLARARESSTLRFRFHLPAEIMGERDRLRLSAHTGGVRLPSVGYAAPGEQLYACEIPEAVGSGRSIVVDFEIDSAREPSPSDLRELGVQVMFRASSGAYAHRIEPFILCQS